MRSTVVPILVIGLVSVAAGTIYTGATGRLEFTVKPERYPNAFSCRRTEVTPPPRPPAKGPASQDVAYEPVAASEPAEAGTPREPESAPGEIETDIPLIVFEDVEEAWLDGTLFIDARSPKHYRAGETLTDSEKFAQMRVSIARDAGLALMGLHSLAASFLVRKKEAA